MGKNVGDGEDVAASTIQPSPPLSPVSPLSPSAPSPSRGVRRRSTVRRDWLTLFKRANYNKFLVLFKSLINAASAAFVCIAFVWRDYGLVDLVSTLTNFNRYTVILVLGRSILFTICQMCILIDMTPPA